MKKAALIVLFALCCFAITIWAIMRHHEQQPYYKAHPIPTNDFRPATNWYPANSEY